MNEERLVEVLRALGIEARRRGNHLRAPCPSPEHDDKHPSWGMRLDDRAHPHMCWGCKYKGNLVMLASERLGVSFAAAEAWVRGRGAEPTPDAVRVRVVEPWGREMRRPFGVVVAPLAEWVTPAREYLARPDRGITAAQVERWGLGYAAQGRLAGRVYIPAIGARGELLNYTARTFVGDEKRFLNAAREEGPVEGSLFGEGSWPSSRGSERVVVTEGPIDALAVERAVAGLGVRVAALFGSDVHPLHAIKLGSFGGGVVVLTDVDAAGDAAASVLLAAVRGARARLPGGLDAASSPLGVVREEVLRCLSTL